MKPKHRKETATPPKEVWNSHNVASRATVGAKLYVKVYAARLMADITPTADVLMVLFPGDAVTWHGSHPTDKRWHKISAVSYRIQPAGDNLHINPPLGTTVTGYIFGANLSTSPPDMTLRAKDGPRVIDPIAYPSSGQAVKG